MQETFPENVVADAGYGSEENYGYLDEMEIGKYVKYNWFDREQKSSFRRDKFNVGNLPYDGENKFLHMSGREKTCTCGNRESRYRNRLQDNRKNVRVRKLYRMQVQKEMPQVEKQPADSNPARSGDFQR